MTDQLTARQVVDLVHSHAADRADLRPTERPQLHSTPRMQVVPTPEHIHLSSRKRFPADWAHLYRHCSRTGNFRR